MNTFNTAGESPNPAKSGAPSGSVAEWIYPDSMPRDEEQRISKALNDHFNMSYTSPEVPVPAKITRALATHPDLLNQVRYAIHYALVTPSRRPALMRLLDAIGGAVSAVFIQVADRPENSDLIETFLIDVSVPHNWGTDPFLVAACDAADAINGVRAEASSR